MKRNKSILKITLIRQPFFIRVQVILLSLVLMSSFSIPLMAQEQGPLDECIGVDHPPFDQPYEGDGYSYLIAGLTMPLEFYDFGYEFKGELIGNNQSVTSTASLDDKGQIFFYFPLYSYGSYDLIIYDDKGTSLYQNSVLVDESELACDPSALAVSPSREEISPPPENQENTTTTATTTTETAVESITETIDDTGKERNTSDDTSTGEPVEEKEEVKDSNWWILVPISALVLVFIGVFLGLKKNCQKEKMLGF